VSNLYLAVLSEIFQRLAALAEKGFLIESLEEEILLSEKSLITNNRPPPSISISQKALNQEIQVGFMV
jgi:hypothetical protein